MTKPHFWPQRCSCPHHCALWKDLLLSPWPSPYVVPKSHRVYFIGRLKGLASSCKGVWECVFWILPQDGGDHSVGNNPNIGRCSRMLYSHKWQKSLTVSTSWIQSCLFTTLSLFMILWAEMTFLLFVQILPSLKISAYVPSWSLLMWFYIFLAFLILHALTAPAM